MGFQVPFPSLECELACLSPSNFVVFVSSQKVGRRVRRSSAGDVPLSATQHWTHCKNVRLTIIGIATVTGCCQGNGRVSPSSLQ